MCVRLKLVDQCLTNTLLSPLISFLFPTLSKQQHNMATLTQQLPSLINSILPRKRKASEDLHHSSPIKRYKFEGLPHPTLPEDMFQEIIPHCDEVSLLMLSIVFAKNPLIKRQLVEEYNSRLVHTSLYNGPTFDKNDPAFKDKKYRYMHYVTMNNEDLANNTYLTFRHLRGQPDSHQSVYAFVKSVKYVYTSIMEYLFETETCFRRFTRMQLTGLSMVWECHQLESLKTLFLLCGKDLWNSELWNSSKQNTPAVKYMDSNLSHVRDAAECFIYAFEHGMPISYDFVQYVISNPTCPLFHYARKLKLPCLPYSPSSLFYFDKLDSYLSDL